MLTWLKPGLFMYLLGENNLRELWLGKTLNAWISVTRRNQLMRLAHWTSHFDGLSDKPLSDPLSLLPSGSSRDQCGGP